MVTHKKMGEVFFALVRNGTLITFTQTKLIVQLIVHFFINWLTSNFDAQHAFGVSVVLKTHI